MQLLCYDVFPFLWTDFGLRASGEESMNDTLRRKSLLFGRGAPLMRGPVLATILFCLAYGSVMALIIAPRSLLTGNEDAAITAADSDRAAGIQMGGIQMGEDPQGQPVTQLLKAGYTPLSAGSGGRDGSASSAYGIAD